MYGSLGAKGSQLTSLVGSFYFLVGFVTDQFVCIAVFCKFFYFVADRTSWSALFCSRIRQRREIASQSIFEDASTVWKVALTYNISVINSYVRFKHEGHNLELDVLRPV